VLAKLRDVLYSLILLFKRMKLKETEKYPQSAKTIETKRSNAAVIATWNLRFLKRSFFSLRVPFVGHFSSVVAGVKAASQ